MEQLKFDEFDNYLDSVSEINKVNKLSKQSDKQYSGKHRNNNKLEFSKKVVMWVGIVNTVVIICSIIIAFITYNATIFCYLIPAVTAWAATVIAFYMNKSRDENSRKIEIAYRQQYAELLLEYNITPTAENLAAAKLSD